MNVVYLTHWILSTFHLSVCDFLILVYHNIWVISFCVIVPKKQESRNKKFVSNHGVFVTDLYNLWVIHIICD